MQRLSKRLAVILVMALLMGIVSLPDSVKNRLPENGVTTWLREQKIHLGLDLQGGTQLDYRVDLARAEAKNSDTDPSNDVVIRDLVEGVRTTLERRVNNLGVSEPQIYLSHVADEQHIIVELAGIKDIAEAKRVVGKTIQLEFKEPRDTLAEDKKADIQARAADALKQARAADADFKTVGELIQTVDKKIEYRHEKQAFADVVPAHYKEIFSALQPGATHHAVVEGSDGYVLNGGNFSEKKGLYVVQLVKKEVAERQKKQSGELFLDVAIDVSDDPGVTLSDRVRSDFSEAEAKAIWDTEVGKLTSIIETEDQLAVYKVVDKNRPKKEVKASHILIAYQGADRAEESVTRSKKAAKILAENLREQVLADVGQFEELAREHSDGPSAPQGGDLGFFGTGTMAAPFEKAAFALRPGQISDVVETAFGFHVIKVMEVKDPKEEQVRVEKLVVSKTKENARAVIQEALARTEDRDITVEEERFTYNEIFFDITPDPWQLTGLDGSHFKTASVTYDQIGAPIVSIQFNAKGGDLFAELTERLTNKQMAIFVGGEMISAPRVNEKIVGGSAVITGNFDLPSALALANDLNTGAIEAPVVLTGQYTISATLGDEALQVSIYAGMVGLILLAVFMLFYYRFFGLLATVALLIYAIIIIFLLKISPIVMTLAGIAGIILSIGMAVDANILIFERTKEELKAGKNFMAAVSTGFERAWTSIRDSNVSSLITCAILWFFGNSIIRGFALMLALGILVSMFTAITVTRALLNTAVGTWISRNRFLLGSRTPTILNQ